MAFITGAPTIGQLDLYQSSTTAIGGFEVGQLVAGKAGRFYRLALVGGSPTALVMGNALQSSVIGTSYSNMAVGTAGVAGDTFLQVTNGSATITSQQFEGGSLSVYTAGTVAVADEYTILGVTGTLTSAGALTVQLDRPLRSAFTTSATVNMRRSPWSGVIQAPATTLTGTPAGFAMFATPASTAVYCFVQTHGTGAVLSDGSSILVGSEIALPSGTAGAVILSSAGLAHVGYAMQAAASAKGIAAHILVD